MAISEKKFRKVRLFKISRELNVSVDHLVEHLQDAGYADALSGKGLNAAVTDEEAYLEVLEAFASDKQTANRVKDLRAARRAELEEESTFEEDPSEEAPVEEAVAEQAEQVVVEEEQVDDSVEEVESIEETESTEEVESVVADESIEAPTDDREVVAEAESVVEAPVEDVTAAPETGAQAAQEATDTEEPVAAAEPATEESDAATVSDSPETEEPEDEELPTVVESAGDLPVEEAPTVEEEQEPVAAVDDEADIEVEDEPVTLVDDTPAEAVQEVATGEEEDETVITADRYQLQGTKVLGKLDLSQIKDDKPAKSKRKRKRKRKTTTTTETAVKVTKAEVVEKKAKAKKARKKKPKVDQEEVQQTLQDTLRELEQGAARVRQRRRRSRRQQRAEEREMAQLQREEQEQTLRVTEFVSTGELADLMGVAVTDVIGTLFSAGLMVSINQRLDADTIQFVVDEYGFEVEFITDFATEDIEIAEDDPEDLQSRAPVVTVMGHVDHGKTSLLDYVRKANVVAGESGGITQHIGAYKVVLANEREITFLDTPGHEAFTAMRARGAQVTDVVILVVAANDAVMPQTIEAINHARAAEVPLVVAINKVDLPEANIQRVMQQLSEQNVLVEQYGGNVQCAQVSAKTGDGIDDLLDKVLLEADLLELQGNPDRYANGIVIESRLDKGRGNVATVLVQNGTLNVGDSFVAGIYNGRVRAMFDERDHRVTVVGPSEPALVLGFNGSPSVGDQLIVLEEESEARDIAQRRQQIFREQKLRQRKHVSLEDIGRRMALGDFSELNLIIKGDVGGSVEALSDSLQKLSTNEVAVAIIHSGVGAISESDVMLASASDAVIIGFQVRPTAGARSAAEREEIDIHTYSIIYNAIEDVRDALEGLLTPEESEKMIGAAEVRETFKVPKVGMIAGCLVTEGRIKRNDTVHVVREGVVIYDSKVSSLKRFKDDAREVQSGYECGIGIENFNDLKVGDLIESYEIVETKRKLEV